MTFLLFFLSSLDTRHVFTPEGRQVASVAPGGRRLQPVQAKLKWDSQGQVKHRPIHACRSERMAPCPEGMPSS